MYLVTFHHCFFHLNRWKYSAFHKERSKVRKHMVKTWFSDWNIVFLLIFFGSTFLIFIPRPLSGVPSHMLGPTALNNVSWQTVACCPCALCEYSAECSGAHVGLVGALCISVSTSEHLRPRGAIRSSENLPISVQPKVSFSEFQLSCESKCKAGPDPACYHSAVTCTSDSWYEWRAMCRAELRVRLMAGPAVSTNKSESPSESESE